MNNLWIRSVALAALLLLAACGSCPSDADVAKALTAFAVDIGVPEKQAAPKSLRDAKGEGDGYECDFLVEDAPHHGRFVKFDDGWKLVGQLG